MSLGAPNKEIPHERIDLRDLIQRNELQEDYSRPADMLKDALKNQVEWITDDTVELIQTFTWQLCFIFRLKQNRKWCIISCYGSKIGWSSDPNRNLRIPSPEDFLNEQLKSVTAFSDKDVLIKHLNKAKSYFSGYPEYIDRLIEKVSDYPQ